MSNILHERKVEIKTSAQLSKERQQKMVGMFDIKDGQFPIKVFPSMMDAASFIHNNGISTSKDIKGIRSHISQVCNGKRKSAYKYIWKFL